MPNAPETVLVDTLSDKKLKISWSRPSRNYVSLTHYYVNISALPGFDSLAANGNDADDSRSKIESDQPFFMQIKVRNIGILLNL